jgi:cell division initiation protein
MNLPEEIRNKKFNKSLRGYDIDEVEDYIELLLHKYDELYAEKKASDSSVRRLEGQAVRAQAILDSASDITDKAKSDSATILAATNNEAERTLERVRLECGSMVKSVEAKINRKREEYDDLRKEVAEFKVNLLKLYEEHIATLQKITTATEHDNIQTREVIRESNTPAAKTPKNPKPVTPRPIRQKPKEPEPFRNIYLDAIPITRENIDK